NHGRSEERVCMGIARSPCQADLLRWDALSREEPAHRFADRLATIGAGSAADDYLAKRALPPSSYGIDASPVRTFAEDTFRAWPVRGQHNEHLASSIGKRAGQCCRPPRNHRRECHDRKQQSYGGEGIKDK